MKALESSSSPDLPKRTLGIVQKHFQLPLKIDYFFWGDKQN